ncbi:MAG TPA: flagellar basal-body rod protein FlgF [Burkholderiaceae bacterium]|nr:flagellar basal-body rod protein FlgF [Burkholderiaceae bacterium]
MDRMIYLSMTGAKTLMQRQETLAHNLANANTTGFRADTVAFRAVPIRGDGATTRVFSLETTAGFDDKQGPVQQTGRSLDVAVRGNAWLAVQGQDGVEAYTRDGNLQVDNEGTLRTAGGRAVLSDGGPITVPQGARLSFGEDGTLTATDANGRSSTVARLKLARAEDVRLTKGLDGLFRTESGDPLPADLNARLASGALEGSNVNVVESMVGMISLARQFEVQMKMLQTAESDERAATRLLGPNG